ncbi:hypothetical protein [Clostridium estertheticum]|uniref:hypothetical protein n=1 Tax=Clostridium estertheticum TaxID=238834 RepID=UPI001CF46979|nr:hypothetical protein [Clostridium estertheticum]MCB2359378.1 hypothetical protein [Clostridium estertheticum]
MNLEDNFIKYKNITLAIIEIVKIEEYEKLDEIFQKRQLVIDDMNKINYDKVELKKLYLQYEIEKLEENLSSRMKYKKDELLNKLKKNKKRQTGMRGYNNFPSKAVFLSKKI